MATGVGDIFLDLKLNKQPFEKGLNETKASANLAGRKIGLAIGGAIAGAVGAVGFSALVSSTAKLGDAIDKTSQKMGMSAQAYQEWDFIMQRCGTSMESMTMAMKTLASSAVTSKDALSELGISQAEVASLSQEQLFARTIQALQNVEDTTRRTYLAGQLLGRGATELGAVLNMTASETDGLRQRVWELGGVMSQQAVTASAQYTDAMLDLKMAFRGVSDTVAVTVLPIITSAINKVIIPLILRAVAVVRYFGNILSSVFGGFGKKIKSTFGIGAQKQTAKFSDGIGGVGKSIGGAGKSAKKAKKAVRELNRELMGFDKMNKLAKKNKASDAGGGGAGGGVGGVGGVGGFGDALGGANDKLFDFSKISEKLKPIWVALGDVFKAVIRLFKAVGKALAPVGKWIWEHLIKPFGRLLGMAIVAVLEGIAGAIELLASFIEKHPKISATIISIATGLFLIIKAGGVLGIISKLGKAFKILGGVLAGNWIGLLLIGIALAIGYIYKNWDKIKKTKFGKFLIAFGKACKTAGVAIKKHFASRIKTMVAGVKIAWAVLKKLVAFFRGKLKKAIQIVSKPLEKVSKIWNSFKDKKAKLTTKFAGVKEKTVEAMGKAYASVSTKTATITAKLKGKTQKQIESLGNAFKNVKSRKATLTAKLAGFKEKTLDKLRSFFGKLKNKTATLKVNLKATIASGYNKMAKKINGLIGKLPKAVRPSWRLPYLAQGGFLEKNTPKLAVVGDNKHEGEIVSPESKLKAMAEEVARNAGGGNAEMISLLRQILVAVTNVDPNVYLDGREIANNTVKQINQQTRTTGVSPLLV